MARGGSRGGRGGGGSSSGGGSSGDKNWTSKRYTHYHGKGNGDLPKNPKAAALEILAVLVGSFLFAGLVAWIVISAQQKSLDIQISTYASKAYKEVVQESPAPEDHLVIVFGVWRDRQGFDYVAWVGDHINDDTFDKVGSSNALLGKLLVKKVSAWYGDTLAEDLALILPELAEAIRADSPQGCYTCQEEHSDAVSRWINRSDLVFESTAELDQAMKDFTQITGIPLTLILEDERDIFTVPNY